MKNLAMIACVSSDLGLGNDNQLLWNLPEDMDFFKTTTMGHPVIMGGNTYQSIGRALPGRENLVLSRSEVKGKDIEWFSDKKVLDDYLATLPGEKFIIGGASIYKLYLDEVEKIYLTEVDGKKPADVFFPDFNKADFQKSVIKTGEHNGISYQIVLYTRK